MKSATVSILSVMWAATALAADSTAQQVDHLFAAFDRPGSPGCSVAVIRNGHVVYNKSFGYASLELGVPLTPQSVFYVGSVSKQFTAASVVLAAEQGRLSLDDNVREYIPELPDYGHPITLREMLHQTSGLRDFLDLVDISGRDPSNFNSPNEILKLIERQKGLNNLPGTAWVYSNTNYFLLGIVLQRATGKTLAEYAKVNIFRPLGMAHTRFYDDASVVVPGRVAAYDPGPNGQFLVDWSTTYAVVGGGGLMTSVEDLLRWDSNFYIDRLGHGALVKQLQTPGVLNDGNKIIYAMGLMPGDYRGLPIIDHSGSMFGYRADMLRFPKQKFTVACLCNLSSADPEEKSRQVADIYLESEMQSNSTPIATVDRDLPDPAAFAGQYLDSRTHTIYSFTSSSGSLRGWGSDLRRKNANQFYDPYGDVVTFKGSKDSMTVSVDMNGEAYVSGSRLSEFHLDDTALQPFAGDYKSSEVDGEIQLSVKNGNLTLKNRSNPPVILTPIARDEFKAAGGLLLEFHRDKHDGVSGLSVSTPRARGIEFVRAE